ncbi:MAG TPA: ATP-binding protein, partial [Terriglobia bacterium]|nr:ATP-binding protein [Terriglobia bacterium]
PVGGGGTGTCLGDALTAARPGAGQQTTDSSIAMTFRSAIFRRILWSAFLLIAVALLVLNFYLRRYTAEHQADAARQQLTVGAQILAGELAAVPPAELQRWSIDAGRRAAARVTLIDPSGVVLADSQHDPGSMENHAGRAEIRQAYDGQAGSSIRHSATLDRDLCYLALPAAYGGKPGYVLRLALPLEDLNAATRAVRLRILEASLLAALAALVIAYFFSRAFTGRIDRLRRYAESFGDARAAAGPPPAGEDELGSLGRSLERTGAQLRGLVDRLSLESARREAILSSMVEGVLAVDGDLRVTFCNASFARLIGSRIPGAERVPLVDLVRDPGLIGMISRGLASGESVKQRLQLPAAEGRAFEVQIAPLEAPAGRGAIAILHDITDLERLERVRRDFVANVSHELRTPLTAILGYAETLLEGALEDKENNRRFVEIIKAHAVRLEHIARDLLTLSELESGKAPGEPERISLRAAVQAALRTVESEARVRGVSLISSKLEDVEVSADRLRLEQALVNLLDNSVKFNRPGGEVRVEASRSSDGRARIAIADTGIGIPSEDLSRIFERFYRVDKARSREVGGTGLGLSIVKHVVERMNGTIEVESTLGKGSTFTLRLPADPALDAGPAA